MLMLIYGFCSPSEIKPLHEHISICFDNVSEWIMANRLQLNQLKTEVMWCLSARRQNQVPLIPMLIGNTSVPTVFSVRDLGSFYKVCINNSFYGNSQDVFCHTSTNMLCALVIDSRCTHHSDTCSCYKQG